MRVAVANLTSGGLSGGYQKYLARLMPLLARDPRIAALTVFVPAAAGRVIDDQTVDVRPWPTEDARRGYRSLRHDIAAFGADVVFVPTARHVRFGSIPVVSMVRNMEPLTVPFGGNTATEAAKNLVRAWEARRACRRATRTIAVSRHVQAFLVDRWGIAPERVGLVYHGVDLPSSAPPPPPAARRQICTSGSIRPARGLEDIIRALAAIEGVRLVIAGGVDQGGAPYASRLRRLADRLGLASRIEWAGHLNAGALLDLLRQSGAFVMTSRAEACPNTALEAMSAGCAVVSVDRAPMPEFFGDAAVYYPAGRPDSLAARLRTLLADDSARAGLGRAGLARAASFRWDTTCDRTIAELQRAC